jgi:hypothetical protein
MTSEELFQYAQKQKLEESTDHFKRETYRLITINLDSGDSVEDVLKWLKGRIAWRKKGGNEEERIEAQWMEELVNYIENAPSTMSKIVELSVKLSKQQAFLDYLIYTHAAYGLIKGASEDAIKTANELMGLVTFEATKQYHTHK